MLAIGNGLGMRVKRPWSDLPINVAVDLRAPEIAEMRRQGSTGYRIF